MGIRSAGRSVSLIRTTRELPKFSMRKQTPFLLLLWATACSRAVVVRSVPLRELYLCAVDTSAKWRVARPIRPSMEKSSSLSKYFALVAQKYLKCSWLVMRQRALTTLEGGLGGRVPGHVKSERRANGETVVLKMSTCLGDAVACTEAASLPERLSLFGSW